MAEIRDIRVVLRRAGVVGFARKLWFEIGDDNLFTWAAALAYSWLFAVFPFFLVLLSLIPLLKVEWRLEAKNQISRAIEQLPREARMTVQQYIEPKLDALLLEKPRGISGILSAGLLVAAWAASGGMAMTMAAMDRCFDVERARPFYKQRPLAVMLTLIVATLIIAVVVLIPVGSVVARYLMQGTDALLRVANLGQGATTIPTSMPAGGFTVRSGYFWFWFVLFQVFRYGIALLFLFWVVGLIYHFGPNVKQRFRLVTPGSVFTIGVWLLLGATFKLYVDKFGKYGQTYGAVGGVIILLFFFYIDALVLLIGAEINSEIDASNRLAHAETPKPPPPEEVVDTEKAVETP